MARANPITYVSADDPPFLIMHGDQDETVLVGQSELLIEALDRAHVIATFRPIAGAGHGGPAFARAENIQLVEDFFARHLKRQP